MTNAKSVADLFCTWLADRVSPAQLSELYQMYRVKMPQARILMSKTNSL